MFKKTVEPTNKTRGRFSQKEKIQQEKKKIKHEKKIKIKKAPKKEVNRVKKTLVVK